MKTKKLLARAAQLCIVHCALCIALLASCQQETLSPLGNLLPPDGEIRITASVNNPSPFEGSRGAVTRAGMDSENLDRFGLYIKNPAAAKYSYDNEYIVKAGGVWTPYNPNTATPLDDPLLWGSANQEVTVTAYYPYFPSEQIADGVIASSVSIDQTQPHLVWLSDLLWAQSAVTPSAPDANNDIHYNASTKSLVVQMNHVLSKLRVNIRYGSSLMPDSPSTPTQSTAPTLGDVTLSGTRTDYNFTPADGKVAVDPDITTPIDIKMYHEPASAVTPGQHATCEAIIVPQTAAFSLKIVADGKTYTYTHPTTGGIGGYTFESDKIYILNLVVGKDAVTLGSVTVKEWSKDTPLPDGNATPAPFTDPEFVKALTAEPHNVPLTNERIDPNDDDTKEALEKITSLNVTQKGIKSLKGIEYLTGLTELFCDNNSLTTLDVSQNKALTYLKCNANSLTTLDVSSCTELTKLHCVANFFSTLDVSQNKELVELLCHMNHLTTLDVSQNKELTILWCYYNRLTTLDITAFTNDLTDFKCGDQADDNGAPGRTLTLTLMPAQQTTIETAGWNIGDDVTFDPYTPFEDAAFVAVLAAAPHYVPLTEGKIDLTDPTTLEALAAITALGVSNNTSIRSLRGIEYLTGLTYLYTNGCTALTTLNVSGCKKLTQLNADGCTSLTALDVRGCEALTELIAIGCTSLNALDVRGCEALTKLYATGCTALTALNVRGLTGLTQLDADRCTALTALDVRGCEALTQLYATGCTSLTALNAGGCEALTKLSFDGSTALTTLNVRGCKALPTMHCSELGLTTLDVRDCTAITNLFCNGNRLTTLDVRGCTALIVLDCPDNPALTTLNANGCEALTQLSADGNSALATIDVGGCKKLTVLGCPELALTSLNVRGCEALTVLQCYGNRLTTLDVSSLTKLTVLRCDGNRLTTLDITALPASMDEFYCGNQQDGRKLSLLLRKDQQAMWEMFSDNPDNAGVTAQSN